MSEKKALWSPQCREYAFGKYSKYWENDNNIITLIYKKMA